MFKAIFFDAAGTLIYLPKGVGYHYALVGQWIGLEIEAAELDRAFALAWKQMPQRPSTGRPREDDDKGWWRELVARMFDEVSLSIDELDRDAFFEVAYEHFAEAGVWELYPEVTDVLEALRDRFELSVVSNFDGRLRMILKHLGISKFFEHIFVSSELGADKPDPAIYMRALEVSGCSAEQVLHVGDDPERDWSAAESARLQIFKLDRNKNSLRDLLSVL